MLTALTAFMGMALVAGPVTAAASEPACALPRTGVHHSLGTSSWNRGYPRPDHTLNAAMVFLTFPDSPQMSSTSQLTADHFPSTSDFYARSSYGRFRLRPHPLKRWIHMPDSSRSYRIRRDWSPRMRTKYLHDAIAVADPHLDFSRYDLIYLVADPDAPGVNSDATKVVNFDDPPEADGTPIRRLVTVFEQSPPDRHVLAHETGHVFDLPDLYRRPASGAADWDTYVGDWDLMGSQFGLAPDVFAWEKWKLGWLRRSNVSCVPTGPGRTSRVLHPLEQTPLRATGDHRLAVVRTGAHEALAIEVRGAEDNDKGLCRTGVLLYWVRSDRGSADSPVRVVDGHPGTDACRATSVYPALADAPLRVGEGYSTERAGGVAVQVTRRTLDGGWVVQVTRGKAGARPAG